MDSSLSFVVFFLAGATAFITLISHLIRPLLTDISLALRVLATYSVLLGVAVIANYLELSPFFFWLGIIGLIAGALGTIVYFYGFQAWTRNFPEHRFEFLEVLVAQLLTFFLGLVPLQTVLPKNTLITGNFICNDSVGHSMLSLGLAKLRTLDLAPYYTEASPQGLHSLVYYFNSAFWKLDAPSFLLPVTWWSLSFVACAVLMLCDFENYQNRFPRVFIAASPACSFLVGMTAYLFFVMQIAVIPLLLGALVLIANIDFRRVSPTQYFSFLISSVGAFLIYGVVPVSIIIAAIGLKIVLGLENGGSEWVQSTKNLFKRIASPRFLGAALLPAILVILPILFAFRTVQIQMVGGTASDLMSAIGNLPGGFLSPFFVTGFWKPNVGYREMMSGADSYFNVILMLVFAVQVWIVAASRPTRASILPLIALILPVLATAILVRNQYINFKYLSFISAFWLPLAVLSLARLIEGTSLRVRISSSIRNATSTATVTISLALLVWYPVRAFSLLPSLPESWFQNLNTLRGKYFEKGAVLVLSREDWFQYYQSGSDDIMPLTLYFTDSYEKQPIQWLVVDRDWKKDAVEFLETKYPRSSERLSVCERTKVGERYYVYAFDCVTEAKTSLNAESK